MLENINQRNAHLHFVGLYFKIMLPITVQKTQENYCVLFR